MRFRDIFFRRVVGLLFVLSLTQLLACGGYGGGNMGTPTGTTVVNGTVSAVSLTSVSNGSGGVQPATAVTLTVPLGMSSLVLCGDQRSSFTTNSSVRVSYTSGLYCSTLVSVTMM
jgi:hypothetical protein